MVSDSLATRRVRRACEAVVSGPRPVGDSLEADADRVEQIAELERLKAAACARQADLAVDLDRSVRSREAAEGLSPRLRGRGVAAQVALARQGSPHRGQVLLGLAHDLATDLPCTREALREGRLDEYAALLVARETGCLSREDRSVIDEEVCGDPELLAGLGTRRLVGELRRRVAAADPAAVVRRARRAEGERHVSLRPAPDTMTYLTALLPLAQGVAAFAALTREADSLRATGVAGERGQGQVMADLLVERLTGQARADQVPVCLDVVISDESLLGAGHEPALIPGHGPVPAQIARELAAAAVEDTVASWVRTLYADPTGRLVALTSKRRLACDGLADFLHLRDQGICRTPWCNAPIRHRDHIVTAFAHGPTDDDNTQGLCEACNHAKQATGWRQRTLDAVEADRHTVETITPTGHRHRSCAPAPPAPARRTARRVSRMELYFSPVLCDYVPA